MEADWDEVAIIGIPPPGPHALPTPVATLAFDTSQELLWAGNDFVSDVPSFYEVANWELKRRLAHVLVLWEWISCIHKIGRYEVVF